VAGVGLRIDSARNQLEEAAASEALLISETMRIEMKAVAQAPRQMPYEQRRGISTWTAL